MGYPCPKFCLCAFLGAQLSAKGSEEDLVQLLLLPDARTLPDIV